MPTVSMWNLLELYSLSDSLALKMSQFFSTMNSSPSVNSLLLIYSPWDMTTTLKKREREREKKTALPSNPEFFTTLHFTSLLPWARHLINTRVPLPKDTAACPLLATCKSLNPLQFGAEHQPLSLHFLIVIIISDVFHSEFALIH